MATVSDIADQIRDVAVRLKQQMANFGWPADQPLAQHVGVQGPTMSGDNFEGYIEIVAKRIERLTKTQLDLDGFGPWLSHITPSLQSLQFGAMNQGSSIQFTNALSIIQMIDAAIPAAPLREPKVNWEDIKTEKGLLPRDLATRLRSIDVRIKELEPRSKEIGKKIADIESAHAAADQLPTDLAELAEKREELNSLIDVAQKLSDEISESGQVVRSAREKLEADIIAAQIRIEQTSENADSLIAKSERALRGATAVGLSKSFEARRQALSKAGFWWVIGLATALIIALIIGWERVTTLKEVLGGDKSATVILVNALLAIVGIGAPVWFAWLSTKQIGTTFRLAEDYAFKSSVAQAYEGYRTEAMDIDDEMRTRLFSAAIDRFEEAPIRLVDPSYHSSPLQEMLNNTSIRSALDKVPNIAEKIAALIPARPGATQSLAAPIAVVASTATIADDGDDAERDR